MVYTLSKEIDRKVTQFMEKELLIGHFEHTIREISKGTALSYNAVAKSMERLKTLNVIANRNRGGEDRPIPYYYLAKLREKLISGGI